MHSHITGRDTQVNYTLRRQTAPNKCRLSIIKDLNVQPRENTGKGYSMGICASAALGLTMGIEITPYNGITTPYTVHHP